MASTFISADDQLEHDPTPFPEPRYTRRLSDKILVAFHHACDERDLEVAGNLLNVLEFMISRAPNLPTGRERRVEESLVAAHERLWSLRNPPVLDC
jgi:hypothetical protein